MIPPCRRRRDGCSGQLMHTQHETIVIAMPMAINTPKTIPTTAPGESGQSSKSNLQSPVSMQQRMAPLQSVS